MNAYSIKRIGAYYYPVIIRNDGNHEEIRNPAHGGPLNYKTKKAAQSWINRREEQDTEFYRHDMSSPQGL